MKKIIKLGITFLIILFIIIGNINTIKAKDSNEIINIYLFHSEYCSHCKEEIKFLERVKKRYSNINIYKYEINDSENESNIKIAEEIYDTEINVVPTLIIGEKIYTGYSEDKTPLRVIATIDYYSKYGYNDEFGTKLGITKLPKIIKSEKRITINKYISKIEKEKLFLNFKFIDVNIDTALTIVNLKSELNVINILVIFLVVYTIYKHKNDIKMSMIIPAVFILTRLSLKILDILSILNNKVFLISILLIIIGLIILIKKENKHIIKYKTIFIVQIIETLAFILQKIIFYEMIDYTYLIRYNLPTIIKSISLFAGMMVEIVLVNFSLIIMMFFIKKAIKLKKT